MFRHKQYTCLVGQGRRLAFPFIYIAVLLSLFTATPVAAQPTGYQEYYVLGYELHVWRAFLGIYDGSDEHIPGRICSTISLVATADYQVIYYDHWEDGYEADLLNPVQPTTEVYGDGDTSNGGTGSDILLAGNDINLVSNQNVTGPTAITGYVAVDPVRNPADLRYDGGDRIITSGGPVDLTHAMWPLRHWNGHSWVGGSWIGGAWEIYSRQAYTDADAYSYRLPIGEDLYDFGGGDTGTYGDFRNVYLQLGAIENNTTISIDNGAGDVVNLTLDQGQAYSSIGYINSTSAPPITINAGTTIRSNKPVQVGLVTGADSPESGPGAGFQSRFLIVQPDPLRGTDYVVPVPSGSPGDEAEVYLSNPNDFEITVNAYDRFAQSTFVISPASYISSTVPYSEKRGGDVPQDTAARFTSSDGTFGVVVCAGTSNIAYDWGFSGIPAKHLTRDYYVSWAPGSYDTPSTENGSPVWVTPLADSTTFYVDLNEDPGGLDGVVDETFTLDVLEQRRIFDPDNDNTGMHVWATGEFAIAWGEDPRTANPYHPYLDMGITTLPLLQRWLDPVLTLDKTADPTILPPAGGVVTFTLVAQTYDVPLVNVGITDTLPISWTYVPNSTHVTYPNGSTGNPEPTIDDRILYWDLSANLDLNQNLTLTFQAQITDADGVSTSVNRGEAVGRHKYSDALFNPGNEATVYISPLNLVKSVSSAQARIGDTLVYTLSYANLSDSMIATDVTLRDVVPIQHAAFQSASDGGTYDNASSTITWALGTLAPGDSDSVTFTVTVNDFVEDGTVIKNVGYINSNQTAKAGSNVVRTTVLAPDVKLTKRGAAVATQGQVTTYTLSYENVGMAQATGVTIQDTIPASTTYVTGSLAINTGSGWITLTDDSDDGDQGAYTPPTLTVTLSTIAAGEAGQIRFNVQVEDDLAPGSLILNSATLDRDLDIPQESNLAVTRISDLLISKAAEQAAVLPGDVISYTLTYENVSTTTTQTGVYVREPIPGYTSLIAGTVYGGDQIEYSWDNGVTWNATLPITPVTHIRWHDAEVPTDTPVTVGFAVQVTTTMPPNTTIQNVAYISSTETAAYFREWVPSNQVEVEVAVVSSHFATIYGMVFEDTDGDGIRDADEAGIPDVLITLDGSSMTTTGINGTYVFSTTVAGMHTVVETDPAVYSPIIRGDTDRPRYFSTTPNEVHVYVTLGNSYQVNFGDMLANSGFSSIYGTVFNDADGDGVQDVDEPGIPNVLITLDEASTATTDLNGNYTFSTTVAGAHTVVETDPNGYLSTTPNEVHVDVILGNGYRVGFGDTLISDDFAFIYGTVFNDANGNGVHDGNETGIPGVTITLDDNIAATTGLHGGYTLSTAVAGVHTVVETDPDGYFSTTSNKVYVDVTLGSNYQVDFGDVLSETRICDADVYEEDDTVAQAVAFVVGTSQAHQFCDDPTDWVRFSAKADTVYTITTYSWGQRADTFLALFDTNGHTLLAANDDYEGATDYSSRIVWQALADGAYYVRTTNRGSLTGYRTDYDLVIGGGTPSTIYLPIVVRNHSDGGRMSDRNAVLYPTGIIIHTCPDAYEVDDTWQQAYAIEAGIAQIHSFDSDTENYAADKDFVWFDASVGKIIIFATAPVTNTQTLMELYDEHGAALVMTGTTRLVWAPTTSGRYYLSVSPEDESASFGCADAVGYNLLMEMLEANVIYLPMVTRNS